MSRTLILAGLLLGTLAWCGSASAAKFTLTPGQPVFSSGVGPLEWSFQSSSDPNGQDGWVGYKLSTETLWHRCLGSSATTTLSNLPDGTYSIQIADDINEDNLAGRGLFQSSINTCAYPSLPPPGAVSADTIVIDSTPPEVGTPGVEVSDRTVQVSVSASDSGTGLASFTWAFGDGTSATTTNPDATHTYLAYGTYSGEVTVTDEAGNHATGNFVVTIAGPAAGPPGSAVAPRPSTTKAPQLTISEARRDAAHLVRDRTHRQSRLNITCTRINAAAFHCKLTWRAVGLSYHATGKLWNYIGSDGRAYWWYAFTGTRKSLVCAARHRSAAPCEQKFRWH